MVTKKISWLMLLSYYISALTEHAHLNNQWYPKQLHELQKKLQQLDLQAQKKFNATLNHTKIKAIVVPHASYLYSGVVAASVFRLLDNKAIKKVIILAPDHRVSFEGIALPTFDTYQTPLGSINVDTATITELAKNKFFKTNNNVFNYEHSLEIELPFIQHYLTDVTVIPLLVGKIDCAQACSSAQSLQKVIDDGTLVIVSSDFVHYGKNYDFTPFNEAIFYRIRNLDSQVIELIEQGSCEKFSHFMEQTHATICGYYPLQILLALMEMGTFGAVEPRLIAYDRSGLQKDNKQSSVSYVGMLFTQEKLADLPIENQLTHYEQAALMQEARDVLHDLFNNKIEEDLLYPIKSFGLKQTHGAFTTLRKKNNNALRGCIGRITSIEPLYKTIAQVTKDSALHDFRFSPVTNKELPEIALTLSILSPIQTITNYKNIILGKNGVILKKNNHSALFLPEVPLEFNWNLDQMLTELSLKAGLPATAWQDKDTQFSVFSSLDIA